MSALPPKASAAVADRRVRFGPIVLQKSPTAERRFFRLEPKQARTANKGDSRPITEVTGEFNARSCYHNRELTPIDNHVVQRANRDTLYSTGVFDLDAGPVTITLPDAGKRFLTMIVIDEDHYVFTVDQMERNRCLSRRQKVGAQISGIH